jgi:WD40 repeat protein
MSIAKLTDCHLKMCTFSPDGKYIVSKVHSNNGNDAIIIWNTDTGNRVMIKNHRSSIFLLKEIFPDDEYFVTGKQKTLEITDFEKTNEILPLYEEKYAFTNSCFVSTENKKYLSNCLKISETDTAKEIIDFYTEGFCNSFSVSPDGTIIACGDNIGNFYLLKLVGFRIGTPIDREAKLFELVENYKSKILQGGWKSLSHKEHLWNEEFEEERYEVQMLNGEWKELEDFEPF